MKNLFFTMFAIVAITTSCQKENLTWVETTVPEDVDVTMLEVWSYEVPLEIKSNGEWMTETSGDWFYLLPESGSGNGTIEICVIDNHSEERQNGTIKVLTKDGNSQTIEIRQKCAADYDDNATLKTNGHIEYAVGYGYNALKGLYPSPDCVTKQILKLADLDSKNLIQYNSSKAVFVEKTVIGSSFEELSNKLNVNASVKGGLFGFTGEVSGNFNLNSYQKGTHEFAMNYIDYEKGVISINAMLVDLLMDYITPSAKIAINGNNKHPLYAMYNGLEGAKKMVRELGTHLIIKAKVGGKLRYNLAVDISKVTGSYDLHAFAKASYASTKINTDASVTDDLKTSYENNRTNCELSFVAHGGKSSLLTSASNANAVEDWKKSLVSEGENYNLSFIGVEAKDDKDIEYLLPIQYLVSLEDIALSDTRITEIEQAINELKSGIQSGSYNTGTEVELKIPTFDNSTTASLIKEITVDGESKALVCSEYIPVINKDKRVTVIYPVIGNQPKFNMGYFIGNESHKPARVSWTGGSVSIREFDQAAFGEGSTVYIKGASVSSTQNTKKVFSGTVKDWNLEAPKDLVSSGKYPLVKIFGSIWLREDYKTRTYHDGISLVGDREYCVYAGRHFYRKVAATAMSNGKSRLAPQGWRVATSNDYGAIENTLLANNISAIGKMFRSGNNTLGFEAPTEIYDGWAAINPQGHWFFAGEGKQNEYNTLDGNHVRINDNAFAIESIDNSCYMPVRLVKE